MDMDGPMPEVVARMPLAESVLLVWRWIADVTCLQNLYERYRQRCYEKVISFPLMMQLISDALLQHEGSGRRSFERAIETGELEASFRAAYGKLHRMPIPLSMGLLAECSDRLRPLYPPQAHTPLPKSLQDFQVVVYDGKALKRVAKRLKKVRGIAGGLLGGRALVALDLVRGMALAMHAHPDGEVNDVRFVGDLVPEVRRRLPGPRLHMGDRAFCDLTQPAHFAQDGDHFLVRYHPRVPFTPDPARPPRTGTDQQGRSYVEHWGWLGSARNRKRRYVRRITLERPGEEPLILITDLLDAEQYPAADLLDLYRMRWGIERMFQQVTEVFGLQGLIGGSPAATIFQFAFCLVLYNLIQLVRAYVAAAQERPREEVSTEKLFDDVQRELVAWCVMIEPEKTVAYFEGDWTEARVRRRLHELLDGVWTDRWIKAPARKRRPVPTPARARTHGSVYRILQAHGKQPHRKRPAGKPGP
jgi:hypothetical protein